MTGNSIRRFVTNIICGFVYSKDGRKKLRVLLNSPLREYVRFIRIDTGLRRLHMRTFVGYQARSLLISVRNKWIYKFPLRRDNYRELAMREYRIVNALRPYSNVNIPDIELINYKDILVRKYPFINGTSLRHAPHDLVMKNMASLAAQVARFLYDIGRADPVEIRDLKPSPDCAPGYMCGWSQGDVYDNFMIDLKTMRVCAFIDWEDARFCDFSYMFRCEKNKLARDFMNAVKTEYDKLWSAQE
ncbi:hypothetical protein HDR61_03910 [bacterium]|nr:hypothetical protein [bacterium]